jgi:manganese transport protein
MKTEEQNQPATPVTVATPAAAPTTAAVANSGWRLPSSEKSLPEAHASVRVPKSLGFWRKLLAFSGPGYLVAVGYMDPGNWATGIEGG